jgi:hypothetical protein
MFFILLRVWRILVNLQMFFNWPRKISFMRCKIVYAYNLYKPLFAALPYILVYNCERTPYGAYLPKHVSGCPNIYPVRLPHKSHFTIVCSYCLQFGQTIALDLNLNPQDILFSHTLFLCSSSSPSLSSSHLLKLYENIRNIC